MPRQRVASFGAGWVTENRHVPAMREHGGFDVVALVDRRIERARRAAERLGVPHAFAGATAHDVPDLDDLGVDVVTCGTAPFNHFEVVASALDSGRHVITEKPFTMTVAQGELLVARARESRRQLAVVHNFQYAPSVQRVDRWVRRGRLGRVRAIWAAQLSNPRRRLPAWYDDLPLGLFYDESPHLLYLVAHFAGRVPDIESVAVVPSTTRPPSRTPAQITVQCSRPLPVTITMNFEAPVSEWHVTLFGEHGAAVVDVFRDIAVWVPNDGLHETWSVLGTSLRASLGHWVGYLRSGPKHLRGDLRYGNDEVFRRFARAIEFGDPPFGITGEDALTVLRAQHEIIASAEGDALSPRPTPGQVPLATPSRDTARRGGRRWRASPPEPRT